MNRRENTSFIRVCLKMLSVFVLMFAGLQTVSGQKIKVACVGNSVTFGYGIDHPEQNSYPAQLQQLLGDQYDVGNFGKSGATLLRKGHRPYMEQKEFQAAVDFQPDVLIVSLGLNDTDPRNWPNYRDEFIVDYMALIESIRTSDGSVPELWIGRMTPVFHTHPRFTSGTRDWFWQIQGDIEVVAQNVGAHLIDWHTPLHARPDLFPDALHPVKEGAAIMARQAYQHLTGDFGGVKTASVFSSHMVLQRHVTIPVWGMANRGEKILVQLNGQKASAVSGVNGQWRVELPAMKAGGPYELIVEGKSGKKVCKDVMIGEVWLCSGQSNMAFQVSQSKNGHQVLKEKRPSSVRLLPFQPIVQTQDVAWDTITLKQVNNLNYLPAAQWTISDDESVASFSAIAWYFGAKLAEELEVPVGLIQMAVGGSPTEAWIDRKTMESHPQLVNMLDDWRNNDHTMQWCRERGGTNIKNSISKGQRHPYEPSYLFEAGIHKLAGFPIKGVLWYQGESNVHNVELHEVLFPTLVNSWRKAWASPELPFYFAQLSSLNRPGWPHFRDSQRRMPRNISNVSMVVTSDVGHETDVHPKLKKPVGERFANLALHQLYHKSDLPFGNISINRVELHKGKLCIHFNHTKTLQTADGKSLRELEVAGPDSLFYPVRAQLKGNQLIIVVGEKLIEAVRYGWQPFSKGNLVNEDGVPASTFYIEHPFSQL